MSKDDHACDWHYDEEIEDRGDHVMLIGVRWCRTCPGSKEETGVTRRLDK